MNIGKRLVVNSIWNFASLVVTVAIQIILAPPIFRLLGGTMFGVWEMTGNIFSYTRLLAVGMNSGVNRWVPKLVVEQDDDGVNRVINTTLAFYLAMTVVAAVLTGWVAWKFPYWADVGPEWFATCRWVVILVGMAMLVFIPLNLFGAVLASGQRFDLVAAADVTGNLIRVVGTLAVLAGGWGIIALSVTHSIGQLVKSLLPWRWSKRVGPKYRIDLRLADWKTLREMLSYSVNTFLYGAGTAIQVNAAVLVTGLILSANVVPEFSLPNRLLLLTSQVVALLTIAINPAASKLDAERKTEQVRLMYLLGTKYAILVSVPLGVLFLLYGGDILKIWLADQYSESMGWVLMLLAVPQTLRAWNEAAFFVVTGLGKHRVFGMATLAGAVGSIVLSVVLVRVFGLGVVGVAVGFGVPVAINSLFILPPYCCRVVGVPLRTLMVRSLLPGVGSAVPFVAVVLLTRWMHWQPQSTLQLGLLGAVWLATLLPGWWWIGFEADEKKRFRAYLPKMRMAQR